MSPAGPAPTIPTCVRISARRALEERRLALADADAQRREAVAAAAAAQLVRERDDEPGAAHAERMAERDRAAVDVHALLVEPELAHDGEALRGERLVQLDEVELAGRDAGAREQLAHGRDRPDAHDARIDARDRAAREARERLGAERAARAPRSRSRRAAAPSLMPLELPAVTVPPARNAGRSFASASAVVSGRGCSSVSTPADGDELVGEAARPPAPRPSAAASAARTRPDPRG